MSNENIIDLLKETLANSLPEGLSEQSAVDIKNYIVKQVYRDKITNTYFFRGIIDTFLKCNIDVVKFCDDVLDGIRQEYVYHGYTMIEDPKIIDYMNYIIEIRTQHVKTKDKAESTVIDDLKEKIEKDSLVKLITEDTIIKIAKEFAETCLNQTFDILYFKSVVSSLPNAVDPTKFCICVLKGIVDKSDQITFNEEVFTSYMMSIFKVIESYQEKDKDNAVS